MEDSHWLLNLLRHATTLIKLCQVIDFNTQHVITKSCWVLPQFLSYKKILMNQILTFYVIFYIFEHKDSWSNLETNYSSVFRLYQMVHDFWFYKLFSQSKVSVYQPIIILYGLCHFFGISFCKNGFLGII